MRPLSMSCVNVSTKSRNQSHEEFKSMLENNKNPETAVLGPQSSFWVVYGAGSKADFLFFLI
jgi:hypothetical protein